MSFLTSSKQKFWVRISGIVLGILILVWLPFEDQNEFGVMVISGMICSWVAVWIFVKTVRNDKKILLRHSLVGIAAGLAIAPLAIILMAFKGGIHGHGTPDYTVTQMQVVLSRLPYFGISGFLVGFGSGLWRFVKRVLPQEQG